MYPHERSLVQKYQGRPFALIGVNSDPDLDAIRRIVDEKELTWRSFWNGPKGTRGPISTAWGVQAWPTLYYLDHHGVIRGIGLRGEEADQLIEELVAEAEASKEPGH